MQKGRLMATYTYAQLRDKVQATIVDILENGQVVGWNGQNYTKADLSKLNELERDYASLAQQESFASARRRYSGRVRYTTGDNC